MNEAFIPLKKRRNSTIPKIHLYLSFMQNFAHGKKCMISTTWHHCQCLSLVHHTLTGEFPINMSFDGSITCAKFAITSSPQLQMKCDWKNLTRLLPFLMPCPPLFATYFTMMCSGRSGNDKSYSYSQSILALSLSIMYTFIYKGLMMMQYMLWIDWMWWCSDPNSRGTEGLLQPSKCWDMTWTPA